MNRRSFIGSVILACAAPTILARTFDGFKWKKNSQGLWVKNPAWQTAQYEVIYVDAPPIFDVRILRDIPCIRNVGLEFVHDSEGKRYNRDPKTGLFHEVPLMICHA